MSVSAVHSAHPSSNKPKTLSSSQLGAAFSKLTQGLTYMSESDYPFVFTSVKDDGKALSRQHVMRSFAPALKKTVFTDPETRKNLTVAAQTAAETSALLRRLGKASDPDDTVAVAQAKKLKQAFGLFSGNVKSLHGYKVGPRDEATGALASDRGLYAYVVVGRTRDKRLVAVSFGSVET